LDQNKKETSHSARHGGGCVVFPILYSSQLRTGDPGTDKWTSQFFTRIAVSLRTLERSVITPGPDTKKQVTDQLAPLLVHAVHGQWGQIDCDQFVEISDTQKWYVRVAFVVRTIITAILPLSLYLLAKQIKPDIVIGSLSDVMAVGAIIWGFVSVYVAMDPLFAAKVATLKDIGGLSVFGKEK
jgi:hypothetical protein